MLLKKKLKRSSLHFGAPCPRPGSQRDSWVIKLGLLDPAGLPWRKTMGSWKEQRFPSWGLPRVQPSCWEWEVDSSRSSDRNSFRRRRSKGQGLGDPVALLFPFPISQAFGHLPHLPGASDLRVPHIKGPWCWLGFSLNLQIYHLADFTIWLQLC